MSTWQDLVTASLIGTERSEVPPAGIPGLLTPDPAAAPQDPAGVLLQRAALLTAARRAGRRPGQADPLPVAEPDDRPAVSTEAGRRLARMLGGQHPDLLAEWLAAAAAGGLRLPPQLLPALLDRGRRAGPRDPGLPRLIAETGGPRARWLAGLNPDWEFVTAHHLTADEAWRLGSTAERRGYLAALRAGDPGAARELIAGGWDAAGPDDRVMFVNVMADGLSLADEPLLEAALDDHAEDVRARAAYLLARLPGSGLGQRMAGRALRCLRVASAAQGPRLVVTPPAEPDAAMRRDGIAPGPAAGGVPVADQARLVLELVARTPLRIWTDQSGLAAAQVVTLRSGDWAPVLFIAWSRAAIAQRNQEWMAALLTRALTGRPPGTAAENEAVRQLARRAGPRLGAPGALPGPEPDAPPVIREAVRVLRFRYDMLKELAG
jgi:Family of unknown function (DUF5691)